MSDAGFSYVGLIKSVAVVKKRGGEELPGLYHVECTGYGPDEGRDLRLSVNSHQKAEQGGQLNPYWGVITGNQGTGVPVQFKGWVNSKDDGWGSVKEYFNVNGARLWQAEGGAPAPQGPPAPTQPPQAQQAAPGAAQAAVVPSSLEYIAAIAAVLPTMPEDVAGYEGKVRGAWVRNQAAKVLSLARLLQREGPGPDWEEVLKNTAWKDAEEPSAPQASPEEPAVQQAEQAAPAAEAPSDWGVPAGAAPESGMGGW